MELLDGGIQILDLKQTEVEFLEAFDVIHRKLRAKILLDNRAEFPKVR